MNELITRERKDRSTQKASYAIAGLVLEVIFPEELDRERILPSFEPFLISGGQEVPVCCTVEVTHNPVAVNDSPQRLLSDISVVWGDRFRFLEDEDGYTTTIRGLDSRTHWAMRSCKDFRCSRVHVPVGAPVREVLSWMLMVAFGQAALSFQAILIHASALVYGENGVAFLGKSGTGKSTHSRLWIENLGAELLNDDNPAVRLDERGSVMIYGTPWSGKCACYINRGLPLKALVRLRQSPANHIKLKNGIGALIAVLPSCTALRWNKTLFTKMNDTLEKMLGSVQVAELDCRPDAEAARLCADHIYKLN